MTNGNDECTVKSQKFGHLIEWFHRQYVPKVYFQTQNLK